MYIKRVLVVTLVVLIVTEARVHAYTDPGSGTLLWQLLLGASVGALFYVRKFLYWIRNRKSPVTDLNAEEAPASEERHASESVK